MTAPRRAHGFLGALERASRIGTGAPLAQWFREHPGIALDAMESESHARWLDDARSKQPPRRPAALTASERDRLRTIYREFYRLPQRDRGDLMRLHNMLERSYKVSRRTLQTIAA